MHAVIHHALVLHASMTGRPTHLGAVLTVVVHREGLGHTLAWGSAGVVAHTSQHACHGHMACVPLTCIYNDSKLPTHAPRHPAVGAYHLLLRSGGACLASRH